MVEPNAPTVGPAATARLSFGEFEIDLTARTLSRSGDRVAIQRKPLEVLIYLASEAPRMVSRDELLKRFWSQAVNEEALTRCVSTIRSLLDDTDSAPRIIETHRSQGYRFIAHLEHRSATPGAWQRSGWLIMALVAAFTLVAILIASRLPQPESVGDNEVISRIAVLPIAVASDAEPWVGVALTDQLMAAVSKIDGVTVVSSNGLVAGMDASTAGERLDVEALLATRLDPAPAGTRLSATLVSTNSAELIWSSSIESAAALTNSAAIDNLARQVAKRLRPMLQLQSATPEVDSAAYRLYLKGRYYWAQRSATGLETAIDAFDEAMAIDPDYVDPVVGAADSWLLLPLYAARPPRETVPRARELALQALALEPRNARARAVLGYIAMVYDWDWVTAERYLREAIASNPNDATAQQWLGELNCYRSDFADCARQFELARGLDPLSPVLAMQRGSASYYGGDYASAFEAYQQAATANPAFALGEYVLGLARVGQRNWQAAINAYRTSLPGLGLEIVGGPLAYALAKNGELDAAADIIRQLENEALKRYVPPSKIAIAYLGLGDRQRARTLLEAAIEARDDRLVYFAVDVHTRDLVEDPEFAEIATALGFK